MKRVAFKMKLHRGQEAEYQRRHDAIWPELAELLHTTGISEYSIFLDPGTLDLIGVLRIAEESALAQLPGEPVMQRWWQYMKDIMETNPDGSPKSIPLNEVFYLP